MRGRLGAFERNTIQTNVRSLQIGLENITASESKIRDTDFAAETANLTRAQILNQAGISVLATANSSAQNVLALLQ
jgi:flagellin